MQRQTTTGRPWPTLEGRLSQSADFTRGGGAPAPDHDATYASRAKRLEAEQRRLIQWAKENGKLGASGRSFAWLDPGCEHQVFFQKTTRRYVKATLPERQKGYGIALGSFDRGATPSEYLDRLDLQIAFSKITSGLSAL